MWKSTNGSRDKNLLIDEVRTLEFLVAGQILKPWKQAKNSEPRNFRGLGSLRVEELGLQKVGISEV